MSVAAPDLRPAPGARPSRPACLDGRRLGDRRREPRVPQHSLVVDQGCDVRVGHVRIEPRTVLVLLDWLPLTHGDLTQLERDESLLLDPVAALARRGPPADDLVAGGGARSPQPLSGAQAVSGAPPAVARRADRWDRSTSAAAPGRRDGLQRSCHWRTSAASVVWRPGARRSAPTSCVVGTAAVQLVRYATCELVRVLCSGRSGSLALLRRRSRSACRISRRTAFAFSSLLANGRRSSGGSTIPQVADVEQVRVQLLLPLPRRHVLSHGPNYPRFRPIVEAWTGRVPPAAARAPVRARG